MQSALPAWYILSNKNNIILRLTLSKCSKIISAKKEQNLKYAKFVLPSDVDDVHEFHHEDIILNLHSFTWVTVVNLLPCLKRKEKATMLSSLINMSITYPNNTIKFNINNNFIKDGNFSWKVLILQ